jgi:hypothetical protein
LDQEALDEPTIEREPAPQPDQPPAPPSTEEEAWWSVIPAEPGTVPQAVPPADPVVLEDLGEAELIEVDVLAVPGPMTHDQAADLIETFPGGQDRPGLAPIPEFDDEPIPVAMMVEQVEAEPVVEAAFEPEAEPGMTIALPVQPPFPSLPPVEAGPLGESPGASPFTPDLRPASLHPGPRALGPLPGLVRAPDSLQIAWPNDERIEVTALGAPIGQPRPSGFPPLAPQPPEGPYLDAEDDRFAATGPTPVVQAAAPLTPPRPVPAVERVSLGQIAPLPVEMNSFEAAEPEAEPVEVLPGPVVPDDVGALPSWDQVTQGGPAVAAPVAVAPVAVAPAEAVSVVADVVAPVPAPPATEVPVKAETPATEVRAKAEARRPDSAHNPWLGLLWVVGLVCLLGGYGATIAADLGYLITDDTIGPALLDGAKVLGQLGTAGALVATALDWRLKRR